MLPVGEYFPKQIERVTETLTIKYENKTVINKRRDFVLYNPL